MTKDELYLLLKNAAPLAGWSDKDSGGDIDLTSLDAILIAAQLYEQYGLRIPSREMKKENFRSAEAVWKLCQKLTEQKGNRI